MSRIHDLKELGQAVWLDYIDRGFMDRGGLDEMVELGVRGVTSNPDIFEKAITGGDDYDEQMRGLAGQGKSPIEIYTELALADIGRAADILRPVHDHTDGRDGYVSLEVDPQLAAKTDETIEQARELFKALGRPNVLIKVPATKEGIPAIRTLISEGVNVNITLMFSMAHYEAVTDAYLTGLEERVAGNKDVSGIASVASFFVSRVDNHVDPMLQDKGDEGLLGKIAIANAKNVYFRFEEIFGSERFRALAAKGARVQRPLWASTSTKNPDYPDTLYVDELIAPMTVNTLPKKTIDAFLDHGAAKRTITCAQEEKQEVAGQLAKLADLGIDLGRVTEEIQVEGVKKFADAFARLLAGVEEKMAKIGG